MTQENYRTTSGLKSVEMKIVHKGLSSEGIIKVQILADRYLHEPFEKMKEELKLLFEQENKNLTEKEEVGLLYQEPNLD